MREGLNRSFVHLFIYFLKVKKKKSTNITINCNLKKDKAKKSETVIEILFYKPHQLNASLQFLPANIAYKALCS